MDRTERFYKIVQLLNAHRAVSCDVFLEKLGVSMASFKRDLEYLRDRLHAPIIWDRKLRGYRLSTPEPDAPPFQLPGLWFNASEVHALLVMEQLLERVQPGLLTPHVAPLKAQIRALLDIGEHPVEDLTRRIRVLPMASRRVDTEKFQLIADALLSQRRLMIQHYNRQTDQKIERQISPQRMVHYRDNWYLDAWCHLRDGLRTFSVDAIEQAERIDLQAKRVSDQALDERVMPGFGIFAGIQTQTAVLRFTPERARWVAQERWHPDQTGEYNDDGFYLLKVPFSDPREIQMDILKFGADVEVLSPNSLRRLVIQSLRNALDAYQP